jgi:hypothetical protein
MKKTETLLKEAKKILSQEHFSYMPDSTFNLKSVKRLRKFFMLTCMSEIGASFVNRISGSVATE